MSDPIRKPDEFPSRSESILSDTIGLEGYSIETPPRSRIEKLLIELKEIIDQGGGSSTAYATSLEITMDEYFVMSATLKNKDGDTLGQVQTVDLPLESVVVNGSYDSINKNVVLTLENGNTVSFSVADLVSGLQTEITSNNKLDADLVDDTNSTHKFTTASDISKLAGIESQANKTTVDSSITDGGTNPVTGGSIYAALARKLGTDTHYAGSSTTGGSATSAAKLDNSKDAGSATQPVYFSSGVPTATTYSLAKSVPADAVFTDTTYESKAAASGGTDVSLVTTGDKYIWNNKQNAIDANNKLSADLVDDANTAHKFATAAQLSQITTNENNISLMEEVNGGWNLLNNVATSQIASPFVITVNSDKSVLVQTTGTISSNSFFEIGYVTLSAGTYVLSGGYSDACRVQDWDGVYKSGANPTTFTLSATTTLRICIRVSTAFSSAEGVLIKPMIVTKALYDKGAINYVPYALSNAELTAKEQVNENNILSLINGGAKNICNMSQSAFDSRAVASATVTRSADTISITGSTDTTTNAFANIYVIGSSQFVPTSNAIPAGDWVAVINGTGTGINSISLAGVYGSTVLRGEVGQPVAFTMPNDVSNSILRLYVEPSTAYDCSFKIMICSAAAWAASHQYEDYCPTLAELYALVKSYHS